MGWRLLIDEEPAGEEAICPRSWDGSRPSWRQYSQCWLLESELTATRLPLPRTKHKHRAHSCPGSLLDLVCLPRVGVQSPEEGAERVKEQKKREWVGLFQNLRRLQDLF